MARRCTVCSHPSRRGIDEALVTGAVFRGVARRYGLSDDAVERHARNHLPLALVEAQEALEVAHADNLLAQVRDLHAKTLQLLQESRAAGDRRAAIVAVGQARANLELLARLLERLETEPKEAQVVIVQFPDGAWKQLQEMTTRELELARDALEEEVKEL